MWVLLVEVLNFTIAAGALLKVEETFKILVVTGLNPQVLSPWRASYSGFQMVKWTDLSLTEKQERKKKSTKLPVETLHWVTLVPKTTHLSKSSKSHWKTLRHLVLYWPCRIRAQSLSEHCLTKHR